MFTGLVDRQGEKVSQFLNGRHGKSYGQWLSGVMCRNLSCGLPEFFK